MHSLVQIWFFFNTNSNVLTQNCNLSLEEIWKTKQNKTQHNKTKNKQTKTSKTKTKQDNRPTVRI